ncbi:hypothetical protein CR513_38831, partial [Mucuna pruriens]
MVVIGRIGKHLFPSIDNVLYVKRIETQSIEHKSINNLYKIDLIDLTKQNVTCLKLGHASLRLISKLKRHNLVRGLSSLVYKVDMLCDACQKRKQIRGSFESKNVISTSRSLELLHIDLFGPTRIVSLGGKQYGLMTILDGHKLCSLPTRMSINIASIISDYGENSKMKTFNNSMTNKEFIIIFLVQELLNRMILWKGKIYLFKR